MKFKAQAGSCLLFVLSMGLAARIGFWGVVVLSFIMAAVCIGRKSISK